MYVGRDTENPSSKAWAVLGLGFGPAAAGSKTQKFREFVVNAVLTLPANSRYSPEAPILARSSLAGALGSRLPFLED